MTNKEKFIEVFGDNPKRHYITKPWEDEEYVPPTITEADKTESLYNYCPNCGAKLTELNRVKTELEESEEGEDADSN